MAYLEIILKFFSDDILNPYHAMTMKASLKLKCYTSVDYNHQEHV